MRFGPFAACLVLALLTAGQRGRVRGARPGRPKLVVMLVVDQMRGDYIDRYASQWTGGLRRLVTEGAWFRRAAYPYRTTLTCVGHATISTGTFPSDARHRRQLVVRSRGRPLRPLHRGPVGHDDQLRRAGGRRQQPAPAARADARRRAAQPAARADARRDVLDEGAHGHHAGRPARRCRDVVQTRRRRASSPRRRTRAPPVPFVAQALQGAAGRTGLRQGVDAAAAGRPLPVRGQGARREAVVRVDGGVSARSQGAPARSPTRRSTRRGRARPSRTRISGGLAVAAVDALKLGQGRGTDFLGISFSALDLVGHDFGPRSHEVQDVLARLDQTIGALLAHLDRTVGAGNYVVGLSADHGVGADSGAGGGDGAAGRPARARAVTAGRAAGPRGGARARARTRSG